MTNLKKGSVAVFKTNNFIDSSILIGANHEYTSPFLNVYDIKQSKYHSSIKVELGSVVHAIYYNLKSGKFERKNFNSNTLNNIEIKLSEINLNEVKLNNIKIDNIETEFYNEYYNKLVILKSVDLELNKKVIKESNDLNNSKFNTSAHLEFLPPVMTIIGYKLLDEKKIICEETGDIKLEFKCKWYNSATKTFSEEYLPYQVLAFIKYSKDKIKDKLEEIKRLIEIKKTCQFPLKDAIVLKDEEGNSTETSLNFGLFTIDSIVWNHYTYQFILKSLHSNKTEFSNGSEYRICNEVYSNERIKFLKPSEFYLIKYEDRSRNKTSRIIRVNQIKIKSKDEIYNSLEEFMVYYNSLQTSKKDELEADLIFNANCLLRKGLIRNFRLQGMIEITPINRFGEQQDKSFFESEYN